MSLQQFLELADCRVGLTQWSRQAVPESGSSDLEGSVTKACVSARDHTGGNIRRTKPTATDIWDKLAVIRQLAEMPVWPIFDFRFWGQMTPKMKIFENVFRIPRRDIELCFVTKFGKNPPLQSCRKPANKKTWAPRDSSQPPLIIPPA